MKPSKHLLRWFWQTLLVVLIASSLQAQSTSREAVKWFNNGLKERNDSKAIEAYKKAIELDGNFIEALINLGMRYKIVGELNEAEVYLQRALTTQPDKITDDLKFKVQFEIANIYLRKNDLAAYEAKVEEARQATQNQALLATLSFEHGRYLYQKQRYREAIAELQRGLRANPANKQYFENLIDLAQKAQRVEGLYARATTEETNNKLQTALSLYQEIMAISPEFRDVSKRVAALENKLDAQRQAQNLTQMYAQALEYDNRGELGAAIALYENLFKSNPDYEDVRVRLRVAKNRLNANHRDQELAGRYSEAMQAMRSDNLTRAIVLFEEIVKQAPDYRDTGGQLDMAKKRIENKTAEAVVQRYYQDGVSDLLRGENLPALNAFKKVAAIDPDYKDVAEKISEAESRLFDAVEAAQKTQSQNARFAARADSLLQTAESLIAERDWQEALITLEQANTLNPKNEKVIQYLAETRTRLDVEQANRVAASRNGLGHILVVAGGAIAVLVVLPLAGAFFLVPTMRMRYFLMIGNLARAASIIERQLEQNPGRLKLYPILANIYLLEKRDDERAIKVYRTVAQLNLATQNKQAIDAMLANYYMVESGEADQEAIKILEERLQDELRQRKSN